MRKAFYRGMIAAVLTVIGFGSANAQYYEIANQLSNLISPALSGAGSYKGYVEASGLAGLGNARANFLGVSTSQGYQYTSWFFMGAGMGVDVAMARREDIDAQLVRPSWADHNSSRTKVMIPVFTDFRFNIGNKAATSFFIDVKLGAAWLIGSSYLDLGSYRMSTGTQFYCRPSLGLRVPVVAGDTRKAFNIGVTYQLLTSNNFYGWNDNSTSLNNIGVTVGFEW